MCLIKSFYHIYGLHVSLDSQGTRYNSLIVTRGLRPLGGQQTDNERSTSARLCSFNWSLETLLVLDMLPRPGMFSQATINTSNHFSKEQLSHSSQTFLDQHVIGGQLSGTPWTSSSSQHKEVHITHSFCHSKFCEHLKTGTCDFPGGSAAKTPHSQCRGPRFHP